MIFPFFIKLLILLCKLEIAAAYTHDSQQPVQSAQTESISPSLPIPMSTLYLKQLIEADVKVVEILREVYRDLILWATDSKYQELKRYLSSFLDDYDGSSGQVPAWDDTSLKILQNPLLLLRLIFRFSVDLKAIEFQLEKLQSTSALETLERLHAVLPNQTKPEIDLLEDAINRLIQILETYDLEPSQVAIGVFGEVSTGYRLERRHILHISYYASNNGYHALAVEWAEVALRMAVEVKDESGIEQAEKLLGRVTSAHDADYEEFSPEQLNFFVQKLNYLKREPGYIRAKIIRQRTQFGKIKNFDSMSVKEERKLKYLKLCSGDNFFTEEAKSKLTCWYESDVNAMFRINPLKVEIHSKDPLLVEYHNFVSKIDADWLIRSAEPRLERTYFKNLVSTHKSAHLRTQRSDFSVQFYTNRTNCSICDKLRTKIQGITGLKTNERAVDSLKLAAYTYGGIFCLHRDAAEPAQSEYVYGSLGTAIATVLFYLTDVESGGYTVYPELGVGVEPKLGSALLWYNLNRDESLARMSHAGCPVILGGPKWIGNMFIRIREQFNTWKCPV